MSSRQSMATRDLLLFVMRFLATLEMTRTMMGAIK